jgi:hypothetical protein
VADGEHGRTLCPNSIGPCGAAQLRANKSQSRSDPRPKGRRCAAADGGRNRRKRFTVSVSRGNHEYSHKTVALEHMTLTGGFLWRQNRGLRRENLGRCGRRRSDRCCFIRGPTRYAAVRCGSLTKTGRSIDVSPAARRQVRFGASPHRAIATAVLLPAQSASAPVSASIAKRAMLRFGCYYRPDAKSPIRLRQIGGTIRFLTLNSQSGAAASHK